MLIQDWTLICDRVLISFLRINQMFETKLEEDMPSLEEMHSHERNSWETQRKTTVFVMPHY